ncbi:DUF3267 domain-containing protein [Thermococcus barophilus]|uniref:Putative membrane-associated metallopeptidase n=1 Tax=Thermococcus barophilus TaxID=55802 RepID=A0A0S1X8R0_THEBA|nr:DUF3267 domain-containing protein [Thermococcus barophilus]ALM74161.1 putative membrane-associated metallopeptidase [Thermococcus barophilus]
MDAPYSLRLNDYEGEIISLAFILFVLSGLVLSPLDFSINFASFWSVLHYLLLPLIFVVLTHEGLHALTARLFGAKVEFGISVFGKINLAPYTAVRTPLRKKKWMYIIIAPVLLSIIAYVLAFTLQSPWWGIVFVFNTSGLAGDLLILMILGKMLDDALIADEGVVMKSTHGFPGISRRVSMIIKIIALALLLYIILNFKVEVVVEK